MNTMEIFANYGCLAAEKKTVYTYGNPAGMEVCYDKITVKIPNGWKLCESQMGDALLESPWGVYKPNEILAGNVNPMFIVIDNDKNQRRIQLEVT